MTAKIGHEVNPDGTEREITVPAIGEERNDVVAQDLADHLRAVAALAGAEADHWRGRDDRYARRMAVIRTKAEEGLLYALFGDRV